MVVSVEQIKAELVDMPQEQQDQLAAFLVHLRHQRDPNVRREITNRIDDHNPANWLSLSELKEKWKD
jgi:hypothetical protein